MTGSSQLMSLSCRIFLLVGMMVSLCQSQVVYFPEKAFGESDHVNGFFSTWYTQHLKVMNEPSLYEKAVDTTLEAYRFLLLPTFENPLAVRVEKFNQQITLRAVRLSGQGGYEPGQIAFEKSGNLDTLEWKRLTNDLNEIDFFMLKVDEEVKGFDGSQWIFEGVRSGQYHMIHRWTPEYNTRERHLEKLIWLSRRFLKHLK